VGSKETSGLCQLDLLIVYSEYQERCGLSQLGLNQFLLVY